MDYTHLRDSDGIPVVLGEGQFGTVYKVRKGTKIYALKELKKIDEHAKQEIELLKEVEHENIIGYESSYERSGRLLILMEYADAGTLTNFVEKFEGDVARWRRALGAEFNTWRFMSHISDAFMYLHRKKIIHRDLKPDNILGVRDADALSWKVADFGVSKLIDAKIVQTYLQQTLAGTLSYMAPEILRGEGYSFSADIWSFGALMSFYCHCGKHYRMFPLFDGSGSKDPVPDCYSKELRELVTRMLSGDPRERPRADVILNECRRDGRQQQGASAQSGNSGGGTQIQGMHPGINCDRCGKNPISGNRFKCMQCDNFDLCSDCFDNHVHREHNMFVIRPPKVVSVDVARLLMLFKGIMEN